MRRLLTLSLVLSALCALPLAAQAGSSFFDIFTEVSVASPPYPGSSLEMAVGASSSSGIITIVGRDFMHLDRCDSGTGSPLPMEASCSSSSGPGGSWAADSFFDVFYDAAIGGPAFAADSFFDIFCDYTTAAGAPAVLVTKHAEFPDGDARRYFDVSHSSSFFDIFYEVAFSPVEHHGFHLHGDVCPQLSVTGVRVSPPTCANGQCGSSLTLQVDLHNDLACVRCKTSDCAGLIMRIGQTGDSLGDPVAEQAASWGSVKSLYR
jgi:hypothetical protein